ncbi:MAG: ATP-binding protein [Nevskia sp.]|nr:ATP-binding protein [Nevskia sp.]
MLIRGADYLAHAVPASAALLVRAAERGGNLGSITAALGRLLQRYGAAELQAAITEALAQGVPHPNAVHLALERRRERRHQPPPVAITLPAHAQARNVPIQPHRLDTVLFITAGKLLGDLAALDSDSALRRRLRQYAAIDLLCLDEVGYLSYSNRHADLLFELTNRRYEHKSTLVTTNKAFSEWNEVFPNAACTVSLIDRLTHHSELIVLEGESYRVKESRERAAQKPKS